MGDRSSDANAAAAHCSTRDLGAHGSSFDWPRRDHRRRRRHDSVTASGAAMAILAAALPLFGPTPFAPGAAVVAAEPELPIHSLRPRADGGVRRGASRDGSSASSGLREIAGDGGIFRAATAPGGGRGQGRGDDDERDRRKRVGGQGDPDVARGDDGEGREDKKRRVGGGGDRDQKGVSGGKQQAGGGVRDRGRGDEDEHVPPPKRDRDEIRADQGGMVDNKPENEITSLGETPSDDKAVFFPINRPDPTAGPTSLPAPTLTPSSDPTLRSTPAPSLSPTTVPANEYSSSGEREGESAAEEEQQQQGQGGSQPPFRDSMDSSPPLDAETKSPRQQAPSSNNGSNEGNGIDWSAGLSIAIIAGSAVVLSILTMAITAACHRWRVCYFKKKTKTKPPPKSPSEERKRRSSLLGSKKNKVGDDQGGRIIPIIRAEQGEHPKTRRERLQEWLKKKDSSTRFLAVGDDPLSDWDVLGMETKSKSKRTPATDERRARTTDKRRLPPRKRQPSQGAQQTRRGGAGPSVVKGKGIPAVKSGELTMEETLLRDAKLHNTVHENEDDNEEGGTDGLNLRPPSGSGFGQSSADRSRKRSQESLPNKYYDNVDDGVRDDATCEFRY
mmetsp:Transcript_57250/g.170731  ORF Transcript_57250/g.170731 Transcript_57250/m.170731 type:complete len:614 (-) Transcript_57250:303-2144(-)